MPDEIDHSEQWRDIDKAVDVVGPAVQENNDGPSAGPASA
jgi:hypothetical protein